MNHYNKYTWAMLGLLLLACCRAQPGSTAGPAETRPLAFPGAEGFGKYTTGGRGGRVYIVTNLNDAGPGSFREAAEAKDRRIIVFAVSGTIHLQTKLGIRGNASVFGQTAPGDGICLADQPVSLAGDNIIVRYIRFRMGDKYQRGGMVDGNGADDAFGGTRRSHIIIDHCSMSWSTDEAFTVYAGDSTTLQWNLVSEPLNYSYHFETGDKDYEHHGYGGIWGGLHLSAHHNLFAHCNNRTPRFNGIRHTPSELADYCNNVIYNWGGNNVYAGEGGTYNIINNYYKYGPNTAKNVRYRICNPGRNETIPFGKWYVHGNFVDGAADVTADNGLGIHMGNGGTDADKRNTVAGKAFAAMPLPVQTAEAAFAAVLKHAGASHRRDTLDARIVNDVTNRTGRFIDVQGGWPHGTEYEKTVNAWPFLQLLPAPPDTDRDGIPDEWERQNGLNPANAADGALVTRHAYYTNLELYCSSLLQH